MMEHDRIALCAPAGRHDADRQAVRAGSTESAIVLGGRRIDMRRPRVRSIAGRELRLPSFEAASKGDPLDRRTLEAIASGVTMRRVSGRVGDATRGSGVGGTWTRCSTGPT
jgi:putative transposase